MKHFIIAILIAIFSALGIGAASAAGIGTSGTSMGSELISDFGNPF